MLALKNFGIDWSGRTLISKQYLDRVLKYGWIHEDTRSLKSGREFRKGCCLSPILFKLYSEYLTKEALEGLQSFNTVQIIRTMKYADDLVLLNKEETLLYRVFDRWIEIGRCCGMEINLEN